jgi:sugar phosphate isomerase/epimerase
MRFGICTSLAEAEEAVEAGFDYVELSASSIATADDVWAYRDLPVEATNAFFPTSFRLFGPEATPIQGYVTDLLAKAEDIGVEVMVVGSGAARRAPYRRYPEACRTAWNRNRTGVSEPHGGQHR